MLGKVDYDLAVTELHMPQLFGIAPDRLAELRRADRRAGTNMHRYGKRSAEVAVELPMQADALRPPGQRRRVRAAGDVRQMETAQVGRVCDMLEQTGLMSR